MKKFLHVMIVFCCSLIADNSYTQTIPQYFFGENAWMPDSVGSTKPNGKLYSNFGSIAGSNVKLMRVGGTLADTAKYKNNQYLKMVDSVRLRNMEPIVQVSFFSGTYDSSVASALVKFLNVTNSRKIKYWSIGNEPDLYKYNGWLNNVTAAKISDYIKKYAIAMKKVDSTIKIIAPEFSYMPTNTSDPLYKVMDSLTTWNGSKSIVNLIPTGNGKASGKGYIDYFSYHMYHYDGAGTNTKTRAWLIARLATTDSGGMGWIQRRCNSITANRASYPVAPMITEANICYYSNGTDPTDDNFAGVKSSGFLAGQQWSEMAAMAMTKQIGNINYWSAIEASELGYLFNSNSNKKSTYYHLQQLGKWFTGTAYFGSDQDGSGNPIQNIKAFGSKDGNHIAVMILNQDTITASYRIYKIRLDNSYPSTGTTKIKMNMGTFSTEITDTVKAAATNLLIFDCNGSLASKYKYDQGGTYTPFQSIGVSGAASLATADAGPFKSCDYNCGTICHVQIGTAAQTGYTYSWSPTTHLDNSTLAQPTASNLTTDIHYTVTATYNGCTATSSMACLATACCCGGSGSPPPRLAGKDSVKTDMVTGSTSSLLGNIPNPSIGTTTIYYLLADNVMQAEIRVTDIYGKIIERIPVSKGSTMAEFNCNSCADGIYFYTLIADGRKIGAEKMIIAK